MSTGAIIAIAVVVALILIALLVLLPRMRAKAAERKREQERLETERRLERERREAVDHHRSASQVQLKQAELAESEARKQRAEAEIHAKRAELHEEGLADDDLASGTQNGRVSPDDRDFGLDDRGRDDEGERIRPVSGGRAHEPLRDEHVRDLDREPASDAGEIRSPAEGDKEFRPSGGDVGRDSGSGGAGARRMTRAEEPDSGDEGDRGPLR